MVHNSVLSRPRRRDESGISLMITCFALIVILIIAGFAIDFGNSRQVARQTQGTTDAAALAAAQSLPPAGTVSTDPVFVKAANYVSQNMFQTSAPTPVSTGCNVATFTCTYTVGSGSSQVGVTVTTPYSGNAAWVYVKACQATPSYFSKTFGGSAPTVCRSSVARYITGTTIASPGVIALGQGPGCQDLDLHGSAGSSLHVPGGAVIVNCGSSPPVYVGNNPTITAGGFYSVGHCPNPSDCVGTESPETPVTQISQPVPDPLASLPVPTTTLVPTLQTLTVTQYNDIEKSKTKPCLDGYYYVTGTGSVDEIPTCTGSTTTFTYVESASFGQNIKEEIDQHCVNAGTVYANICVFMGRANTNSISWNGNSSGVMKFYGSVYAPAGDIDYGGNIEVDIYGQVIAQTYDFGGGGGPKNPGVSVFVPNGTTSIVLPPDIGLQQ